MPAAAELELIHQVRVSTSRDRTELIVTPPIENQEVYALGVRAVNGWETDPRELDQVAFEAANEQVEGATVLKAPHADRVREAFGSRETLIEAMTGLGLTIVDDRGRIIG